MVGFLNAPILSIKPSLPLAAAAMPLTILLLCVIAGIGTVLVLPSRREKSLRKIGGLIALLAGLVGAALLVRYLAGAAPEHPGVGAYFWTFAALAIFGAFRVVTHPQPVYSALYFMLAVMSSAGLFVLLQAEFMAAALVIIYAGAILVTYVFVIMLAAQTLPGGQPLAGLADHDAVSREPILASAVGFTLMGILLMLIFDQSRAVPVAVATAAITPILPGEGSTQSLGRYLFNHQLLNLELSGLILTMAMVGAIVIARRRVVGSGLVVEGEAPVLIAPRTPIDDNPHSLTVDGVDNPRQKAYPQA